MNQHYLKPGEAIVASGDSVITTVLGSCVSVTFFSPAHRLGAMTHGVLPLFPQKASQQDGLDSLFRYVDTSIEQMVNRLKAKGMDPRTLEIKVFGGADVLGQPEKSSLSVGRKNIEAARATLNRLGIPVNRSDTGGVRGRKIIFSTQTGQVKLKRLDAQTAVKATLCSMAPQYMNAPTPR
ncbi:chemotaxis protein CheD [Desulfoplanes sp.]